MLAVDLLRVHQIRIEFHTTKGYNYIMEQLASQGIISVSISAHQINKQGDGAELANRGWLIIKYLDKLKDWNDNGTDPFGAIFNGKIDMNKIGLSGHSRGGEGVVAAGRNQPNVTHSIFYSRH